MKVLTACHHAELSIGGQKVETDFFSIEKKYMGFFSKQYDLRKLIKKKSQIWKVWISGDQCVHGDRIVII